MPGKRYFQGLTKSELKSAIETEIASHAPGEQFTSGFIGELIAIHHHHCSRHGIRPDTFRRFSRIKTGAIYENLLGDRFEAKIGDQWLQLSWPLCIDKYGFGNWMIASLRMATNGFCIERRRKHPLCEVCQTVPSVEVDHVEPEFKVIIKQAIASSSECHTDKAVSVLDLWNESTLDFPKDSPAIRFVKEIHKTAILQAVCKRCHVKNASERNR